MLNEQNFTELDKKSNISLKVLKMSETLSNSGLS